MRQAELRNKALCMPDRHNTSIHLRMYEQEAWAMNEQISALERVAPSASGEGLSRAIAKLAHVVMARDVWLYRIDTSTPKPADLWPQNWTFEMLREALEASGTNWHAYLDRLDAGELDRVVSYTSSAGQAFNDTVRDILMHVWSHGFYHRGQVGTIINTLGGSPPAIDYIVGMRTLES